MTEPREINVDPVKIVAAADIQYTRSIRKNIKERKSYLADRVLDARHKNNAMIKHLVLEEDRIDILAQHVLGYDPQDIHYEMMEFQKKHKEGMILAWRGAAKTTFCTITFAIFNIIKNPDIRILLASSAIDQARVFLKSIKLHFETNERLIEIFGDFFTGARSWTETDIIVPQRRSFAGESTLLATGIGTALPSRHFDLIIADDLVIRKNAQTEHLRKKVHQYFYETLYPTLESPNGRLYVLGTRWHEEDLYKWFAENDYKDSHLIISVFDDEGESRWAEKYPKERMMKIQRANPDAFDLQYMCKTGATQGDIFTEHHFLYYDELPAGVRIWQGLDLAIGTAAHNDFFAHVTIAVDPSTKNVYLVSFRLKKLQFPQQVTFIRSRFKDYPDTQKVVLETNSYQVAMLQQLRHQFPDMPLQGVQTTKDKIARAQKLAWNATHKPIFVLQKHFKFVKMMLGFPHIKGSKDLFDAFDVVYTQATKTSRRKRRSTPSLI